jgi:hypothetical protein
MPSAFHRHARFCAGCYTIKLTANSCIALSSFTKRSQHFIGTHNETLAVVTVCVSNPDRSSLRING